jgi:AcrR family transcriptional regulator
MASRLTVASDAAYFTSMPAKASAAVITYPSRTRHRLQTRDRLFDAAVAEFRRRGVAAAQIEDIVRAAGVARGTFYLHFPTKDHVLMELLWRKQKVVAERLQPARATAVRPFLRRCVDLIVEDAMKEDPALYHEVLAVVARHAPAMRSAESPLVEAVITFLSAAQERGDVRTDLTAFDLGAVFLPGVYGLLQMRLDEPDGELRRALYRVVDIFVRGVSP